MWSVERVISDAIRGGVWRDNKHTQGPRDAGALRGAGAAVGEGALPGRAARELSYAQFVVYCAALCICCSFCFVVCCFVVCFLHFCIFVCLCCFIGVFPPTPPFLIVLLLFLFCSVLFGLIGLCFFVICLCCLLRLCL